MSLGDIIQSIESALTGSPQEETSQNVDLNADPVYDGEQGIQSSSQDAYGDPADQR